MKFYSFLSKSLCLGLLVLAPFQTTQVSAGIVDSVKSTVKWSVAGLVGAWATYRFAPRVLHGTYAACAGDDSTITAALEGIKKNRAEVKGAREDVFKLRSLLVDKINTTHKNYSDKHNAQSKALNKAVVALNNSIFEQRKGSDKTPYLDLIKCEKYKGFMPEFIVTRYSDVKRSVSDWAWSFSDDKNILVTYGGPELCQACRNLKKAAQNALDSLDSHGAAQEQVDVFVENARVVLALIQSLDKSFEARQDEIEQVAKLVGAQIGIQVTQ